VYVNANPEGLQVRFEEPNGQPLGPPRTLESQGELGAQEVATIVRNVLLAQRESLPTTATARDRAPETPREGEAPKRAHVGALYTGTTYAPEVPWFHGPNLMGTFRIHRRLFVGVDYGYHLPRQASKGDIMVQVTQHRLRAFVGGEVPWHSVFLGGDVGVAALGTTRTTQSLATDLQATPETTRWLAAFSATARLRWPLPPFPRTSFLVAPALEWVPAATPMVALGASELVVVDPHLFRFRGDVGVLFEVF
jgi:hypothetical protein